MSMFEKIEPTSEPGVGVYNKTIGTILSNCYASSHSQKIKSDYVSPSEYKELINFKLWSEDSVPVIHDSFIQNGFAKQIAQEFSSLMFGVGSEINFNERTKFADSSELYKLEESLSVFGKCFVKLTKVGDDYKSIIVDHLFVTKYTNTPNTKVFEHILKISNDKKKYTVENRTVEGSKLIISEIEYSMENSTVGKVTPIATIDQSELLVQEFKNNISGDSDYKSVRHLLGILAVYETQIAEEARVGKSKIFVPAKLYHNWSHKDGVRATADLDSTVFYKGRYEDEANSDIKFFQGAIRADEFIKLIDHTRSTILDQVGLSYRNVVNSNNAIQDEKVIKIELSISSTLAKLKQKKQLIQGAYLELIAQIDKPNIEKINFEIKMNNLEPETNIIQKLKTKSEMASVSVHERVKVANPEMTSEEIDAEVARIKFEGGIPMTPEEEASLAKVMNGES